MFIDYVCMHAYVWFIYVYIATFDKNERSVMSKMHVDRYVMLCYVAGLKVIPSLGLIEWLVLCDVPMSLLLLLLLLLSMMEGNVTLVVTVLGILLSWRDSKK